MKLIYPEIFKLINKEYFLYRSEIKDFSVEVTGTIRACKFTGTIKIQYAISRVWKCKFIDGKLVKQLT